MQRALERFVRDQAVELDDMVAERGAGGGGGRFPMRFHAGTSTANRKRASGDGRNFCGEGQDHRTGEGVAENRRGNASSCQRRFFDLSDESPNVDTSKYQRTPWNERMEPGPSVRTGRTPEK